MQPSTFRPLPYQMRADLFSSLATLEKAGIAAHKAFTMLRLPGSGQARVQQTIKLLTRGSDIAGAGNRSGLFTLLETRLLRAALESGSPHAIYKRLAERYTAKARQLAQIKSRLMMPAAVTILALFIGPLPDLAAGKITPGHYLGSALASVAVLGLIAYVIVRLRLWFSSGQDSPLRGLLERAILHTPLFGPMHLRRNGRDFFESLALLLEAGVPMFDALPTALDTIDNRLIRADFARILPAMKQGATLAEAVTELHLSNPQQVHGLLLTGEGSGTLPEMLFRHANLESASIDNFQEQMASWLPRIIYGMVCLWMAYNLLTGANPAMPKIDV